MQNIEIYNTLNTARANGPRLPREQRARDLLDSLGVPYESTDHEAIATIGDCTEIEKLLGIEICKNLFLTNSKKDAYYLLMLPGNKQLVTRELAKQIGSTRLSFAGADKMLEYLDITPGSVSILGLMNDTGANVRLLIDRDLLENEYLGCHPCVNTSSLKLKTDDIINIILPAIKHAPQFVVI